MNEQVLNFAGSKFYIEVMGYEYPDADNYDDNCWLMIKIICETTASRIKFDGPWLRTDEISDLKNALLEIINGKSNQVSLDCLEPALKISFMRRDGDTVLELVLKPHPFAETHMFEFELTEISQGGRSERID